MTKKCNGFQSTCPYHPNRQMTGTKALKILETSKDLKILKTLKLSEGFESFEGLEGFEEASRTFREACRSEASHVQC